MRDTVPPRRGHSSCTIEESQQREPSQSDGHVRLPVATLGNEPLAVVADPGKPGENLVTEEGVVFLAQSKGMLQLQGWLYKSQASVGPLVLIFKADASGPFSSAYAGIGKHLASHGFHVVVLETQILSTLKISAPDLLQEMVGYLYGDNTVQGNMPSPLKGRLTSDVALVGHSVGGQQVLHSCSLIRSPKLSFVKPRQLRSLVTLAPAWGTAWDADEIINAFDSQSPDTSTDSFLGMNVTDDTDGNAYGRKSPGKPMHSAFLLFDLFGRSQPTNMSTVEKDMIFVHWGLLKPGGHYFQNQNFTLAYVAAFLLRNVLKRPGYEVFLKEQQRPPSLVSSPIKIYQQHDDRSRILVMDPDFTTSDFLGLETSPHGLLLSNGVPAAADWSSPHFSDVLRIIWDRTTVTGQSSNNWFRVRFKSKLSLSTAVRYLTFRIGQLYPPMSGQVKQSLDLRIKVSSGKAVSLSNATGSKIDFPIFIPGFFNNHEKKMVEVTKCPMKTFVVPLSHFRETPTSTLEIDWIEFSLFDLFSMQSNGNNKSLLNFDRLAFWQ